MTLTIGLFVSPLHVAIVCDFGCREVGGKSRLPLDPLQAPASQRSPRR